MAILDRPIRTLPPGWTPATTQDEDGRPLELLLTTDAVGGQGRRRAVLGRPRPRRTSSGARVLDATLVLTRAPKVGEALEPLVDRAVLALDVETLPASETLETVLAEALVPLATAFTLVDAEDGRTLAALTLDGPGRAGAVQTTLQRADALAVLGAFGGQKTALTFRAALSYRAAAAAGQTARVRFDLAVVHERLAAVADVSRRFYAADLRHYLGLLVDDGIVRVDPAGVGTDAARLLPAFLRAALPVLERAADPDDAALGEMYVLAADPPPAMQVSAASSASGTGAPSAVTIEARLDELVGDALAGGHADRYLHAVAPSGGGLEPIPLPSPRRRAAPASPKLVAIDGAVTTSWAAVRARPEAVEAPHAHIASKAAMFLAGRHDRYVLADERFDPGEAEEAPGPVADDPAAPLWPDRVDAGRFWYAPQLALVAPDPASATPGATPFLFKFRTVGHGDAGQPFVEATVRLTLERRMSDATRAQWNALGRPTLEAVPGSALSLELRIPYRDEAGVARVQPIAASRVSDDGARVEAEFDLLDRWARVCYGALSQPGFQSIPARLSAAYAFDAWESRQLDVPAVLGAAVLMAPPVEAPRAAPGLAAGLGRLRFPAGVLELRPDIDRARPELEERPIRPIPLPPIPPVVRPRPELEIIRPRPRYWRRTHGHVDELAAVMPCDTLGGLYCQEVDGELRPIGCEEAYRLGQTPRRVHEEVHVAAAGNGTRVFRVLTTPGRFVIAPGHFRIGRHEPSAGVRAFRPTMMLLSTIDVENLANTKCVLTAGLQADVPVAERRAIERELRRLHPSPVVDDVTEVASVEVTWALPQSTSGWRLDEQTVSGPDGFRVALTTDTAGVQAVQRLIAGDGIHGSAAFELSDGQVVRSELHLELDRIVGPPVAGPVSVELAETTARLRNCIESPVAVRDLQVPNGPPIAVDTLLAAGASTDVRVPAGTGSAIPVCSVQATPATLEEVRAYVEDITFEVRFLNLVNLRSHELAGLRVIASQGGEANEQRLELGEGVPHDVLRFMAPLTQFAAHRVIDFRVERLGPDGAVTGVTPTTTWRLDTQGHLISLTPELVLGTPGR